jgi:zinc D-Ala-D-Ala carboxypeptidase
MSRRLTANFSDEEFKCSHCGVNRIELSFVQQLQQLRDAIQKPIHVNSGFRCAAHPVERSKPPGSFSAHMYGIAADIYCPTLSIELLWKAVIQQPLFKGIGVAPWQNYIHVDTRAKPARWAYSRMGETVYWSGKWADLEAVTKFKFTKVE